jgi:hypothetical protein
MSPKHIELRPILHAVQDTAALPGFGLTSSDLLAPVNAAVHAGELKVWNLDRTRADARKYQEGFVYVDEWNDWLKRARLAGKGGEFHLVEGPTELVTPTSTAAPAGPSESIEERSVRRLSRLRLLGGRVERKTGGSWIQCGQRGALARLVKEERRANKPMSDKKNLSDDISRAAEAEYDAMNGGERG